MTQGLASPTRHRIKVSQKRGTVSKSLIQAAGLLRYKYSDLKKHYQQIRGEWPTYQRVTK